MEAALTGIICHWGRDTDEGDEGTPWQEQANWETEQLKKSSMRTGAKDSQAKAKDYEFVFEDQIDFIMDRALAGDLVSFISSLLKTCFWRSSSIENVQTVAILPRI